jgi:hypothetical protein
MPRLVPEVMMLARSLVVSVLAVLPFACTAPNETQRATARVTTDPPMVWIRTTDNADVEGTLTTATTFTFSTPEGLRHVAAADLLSLHRAMKATPPEQARIAAGGAALAGADRKATDAAVADLTDLGLPALTPLLDSYTDVDAHEPDPRYRLFERLVPGRADQLDRTQDLVRCADGSVWRGMWQPQDLIVRSADGAPITVPAASVRRIAVRRNRVEHTFDLQALHHCTYVGFLDTGIAVTPTSRLRADARGFVRLSFAEDGWAADPDGIHDPLPGKRKLQEGFRWGAVLGRVGTDGERWLVGRQCERGDLGRGRLFFVINDNEHWQNNIGSYRVIASATDAYDLGDPL